jgi:hypothetical protein
VPAKIASAQQKQDADEDQASDSDKGSVVEVSSTPHKPATRARATPKIAPAKTTPARTASVQKRMAAGPSPTSTRKVAPKPTASPSRRTTRTTILSQGQNTTAPAAMTVVDEGRELISLADQMLMAGMDSAAPAPARDYGGRFKSADALRREEVAKKRAARENEKIKKAEKKGAEEGDVIEVSD